MNSRDTLDQTTFGEAMLALPIFSTISFFRVLSTFLNKYLFNSICPKQLLTYWCLSEQFYSATFDEMTCVSVTFDHMTFVLSTLTHTTKFY
jgi:hypothetical protein